MSAGEVHVGDVGTVIEVTVMDGAAAVDVSAAAVKTFTLRKPAGATVEKAAAFATDGTDGKLRYTTVAGDLDVVGTWGLQVYVELPTGKWHSDQVKFYVHDNL